MTGKITNSIYFQIKNFKGYLSQFSKEGQEELYTEMKKEINSLRLYRIIAKVLPDIVVLAKLHANKKDKEKRKEVQHLKEVLKGGNWRSIDNNIAEKNSKAIEMRKEEHKRKSSNSEVPTYLSLSQNVAKRENNTTRSTYSIF